MLLNDGEFHENRHRENRSFTMDVNDITFMHLGTFRKNALPHSVYCVKTLASTFPDFYIVNVYNIEH